MFESSFDALPTTLSECVCMCMGEHVDVCMHVSSKGLKFRGEEAQQYNHILYLQYCGTCHSYG